MGSPHGLFHLSPAFLENSMLNFALQQSPRSSEQSNSSICKIKAKATEFTTKSSIPGAKRGSLERFEGWLIGTSIVWRLLEEIERWAMKQKVASWSLSNYSDSYFIALKPYYRSMGMFVGLQNPSNYIYVTTINLCYSTYTILYVYIKQHS